MVGCARIHCLVGGLLEQSSRFGLRAKRAVAALKQYRRRQGQGRSDPAIVRQRQRGGRRAIHAQRRRDGARGIQQSRSPAPGERRWRQRARRAAGGAAGARRRRRDHFGPAVRAHRRPGGSGRARPRRAGDRVLHGHQCGRSRRLSPELSAGVRCRSHHRLRRKPGPAVVRDNAYGSVAEAAFKQAVARGGGRVIALERYPLDKAQMQGPVRNVAQAASRADAIFIPDGADAVPTVVQALTANGIDTKRVQLLGTGLWEDAQIFSNPQLDGAWYAGPDSTGFRNFSARYRSRYGRDPVRTASLAYDAVALVAALVKTQGKQRFSDEVLTTSSGFTGIDGLFRFRPDGTNQRGLAVLRVSPTGGQVISPPPKGFGGSAT